MNLKVSAILGFAFCALFSGCFLGQVEEEELNPCHERTNRLIGTYQITITEYPLQPSTEGWDAEVLVFTQLNRCYSPEDSTRINRILFNGLFEGFGLYNCSGHELLNNDSFIITYPDNVDWAGGPIRGVGNIVDGIFHFEGEVLNSTGNHRIVLDGFKEKQDRRTDAC